MNRFLFKKDGVGVKPIRPQDIDPDGIDVLSLEQASEFSGIEEEILRQRWLRQYADYKLKNEAPAPPAAPTIATLVQDRLESPLLYAVGEHCYRTFVTTEHLIDREGRPAAGRCIYGDKLILISSHFPPATWQETWFHEVAHA